MSAKEQEEPTDSDFRLLATAEEQDMKDMNDINDPDMNFHYSLNSTSQMTTRLPAAAAACDSYNVFDRADAAITSAVLQGIDPISEIDTSHVLDKNEAKREISLKRYEIQFRSNEKWNTARDESIPIFFCGRKDKTLWQLIVGMNFFRIEIVEEHLPIVIEP